MAVQAKRDALLKQVAKIDRQLSKLNGNGAATTVSKPGRRGRRKGWKLSNAIRAKMRAAALRRYGMAKAESPSIGKRKRKPFSAETRAKMVASAKARRAKVKAQ
jgi:hypothetical protein